MNSDKPVSPAEKFVQPTPTPAPAPTPTPEAPAEVPTMPGAEPTAPVYIRDIVISWDQRFKGGYYLEVIYTDGSKELVSGSEPKGQQRYTWIPVRKKVNGEWVALAAQGTDFVSTVYVNPDSTQDTYTTKK
jgi:hypothetical protein